MPPSIWAWTASGLTTGPQSMAQTTRWTFSLPAGETETLQEARRPLEELTGDNALP